MLNTSLKLLIFSSIFCTTSTYASFGKEPNKMITFNGQEKYLMRLIIVCEYDRNHPFSVTQIVRKNNDRFDHIGEISDLNKQDFDNIHHLNYVHLDNHTYRPTRLSKGEIAPVGLLILGTTDKQSCLKLKFKQR